METEKLNINFADGENVKELIIRETSHVNEPLPILEPLELNIVGTIAAPFSFLEKRYEDPQIPVNRSHVIIDRDHLFITLVCNERDAREKQTVTGKIELSRQFVQFGINQGKMWEPEDLGQFFRINRSYFKDRETNMKLVSLLRNFKAKVTSDIEREQKDNGSYTDNYRKIVDSNMPEKFSVCIPIYKGAAPEDFDIEVVAEVHGREVQLELISPDAQSVVEEVRDQIINEQIEKIRELAPMIPIIEK